MQVLRRLLILCVLMPAVGGAQQAALSTQEREFHKAAFNGDLEALQGLHEEGGVAVDVADPDGRTPLMWAGFNGHTAVAAYLLKKGAAINAREASGRTPLMFASSGPFAETVELLLESGADVNRQGSAEGFTALMTAAAEGQVKVVRVLLAYRADPDLKDADGDTAESFARQKGHQEVIELLRNPPPLVKRP